jgi:hypothetical protein
MTAGSVGSKEFALRLGYNPENAASFLRIIQGQAVTQRSSMQRSTPLKHTPITADTWER